MPWFAAGQTFTPQEIARYKAEAQDVTIIRDNWGVPHIYGKTDADAVFGLLYVQCEERFQNVEENNLEMLGRLSEVKGKESLYDDLQMRLIYDSSEAVRDYTNSPAWLKKLLNASADGVNYFLYKHPEVKPAVLTRFEPWFPLMRTDGSISATQTGGLTEQDMAALYKTDVVSIPRIKNHYPIFEPSATGSNGFAVGPSKTASKNAILYINPHVTFYFRDEVHMISEEGLNVYGAVTWGTFFVYQGFNEHCGWMHTTSYADVADLFKEKIRKNGDSSLYLNEGKWYTAKTKKITISFKSGNAIRQQVFITYATNHGPVMGSRNGDWLSLKENNRSLAALEQSWLRTKAAGFVEFKKLMEMRSNNSNNTTFADDKGNIAYWHGNFMPKRNAKYDYSLPVDGSTSASDWNGLHALDELVHVYNPASGWIENCNSTPFTVSGSSSPLKQDYPVYMAPDGQNYRAVNAIQLLEKANNLTIEKLIQDVGYSHYLSAFDVLLPPLLKDFDDLPATEPLKQILKEPLDSLRAWNKNSGASSVATSIAIEWAYRLIKKMSPSKNTYDESDAVGQVNSMIANSSSIERLGFLVETIGDIKKRFGSWKTSWGEINRYQRTNERNFDDNTASLPVGLASATWGSLPSFQARRMSNTNRRYGYSGNSFIACVEFGKKIKAKSVVTGGESFDPSSKHFTDQAQMYIDGNLKDVFFYKEDILKHVERTYHPGE